MASLIGLFTLGRDAGLLDDRVADAVQARVQRLEELEIAHAEAVEREAAQRRQEQPAAAAATATHAPAAPPPAANVHPLPTRAPAAPSTPPSLRLGQINERLGQINERLGFTVTADFLASIGFPMVASEKGAKLWHEADFPAICDAIVDHVTDARELRQAA